MSSSRSKEWRAGTRRNKHIAREAKRLARRKTRNLVPVR